MSYQIRDSAVSALVNDMRSTADTLATQLDKARGHIADITGMWNGNASDAFLATMTTWDRQTERAIGSLDSLAQSLDASRRGFVRAESESVADLSRFERILGGKGA
ncbi:MAG: WXG100 family type VII secretion target [Propionibacteriaceae bacterium]|jgi:WXG100 family type VII secretion target|nr:WXG100 family type VII secretion target [Propionibacteriaceae bacterium]